MKRRVLAAVSAALLLAVVGGVLLLGYVGPADQRAMADLETATVLVVTKRVPSGATRSRAGGRGGGPRAARHGGRPRRRPPGSTELAGRVTTTALVAGGAAARAAGSPTPRRCRRRPGRPGPEGAAPGLGEARAAAGGRRHARRRARRSGSSCRPGRNATQLGLHKVLVTAVSARPRRRPRAATPTARPTEACDRHPGAVRGDAQRVVFAAEHGTIWLSAEPADAPDHPHAASPPRRTSTHEPHRRLHALSRPARAPARTPLPPPSASRLRGGLLATAAPPPTRRPSGAPPSTGPPPVVVLDCAARAADGPSR